MGIKRAFRKIWSFQERNLKDGIAKGEKMMATGKTFTTHCPCIHRTGSVKGMVKLGFWSQDSDKVRHGNYIYEQP